ncbi:STAS domain-containing protein [Uniformispora flossi]|uniref:STAS domain-containing protein n=1 Tax=Uniformispora flossi TaxID=3390723 RepID=UPI003C30C5BE
MPAPDGPTGEDQRPLQDGWRVVTVSGDLDFGTADDLARQLAAPASDGIRRVVLDMTAVEYMDSTGLRVLLTAARELRAAGGDLRLAAARDDVLRIIELTQVGPLLPTYTDIGAACDG